jgi:protein-disulfide isomerase
VKPEIVKQYVDTGKVQMIFKHYAFLGPESQWAAVASECAADQGKFWEYHDKLYNSQQGENQGAFNKDKLIAFAQEMGLDMAKFEPCVNDEQTLDRVQADVAEGQGLGVRGTPNFFINGQPISGALPFEQFQEVIEQALAEAQ